MRFQQVSTISMISPQINPVRTEITLFGELIWWEEIWAAKHSIWKLIPADGLQSWARLELQYSWAPPQYIEVLKTGVSPKSSNPKWSKLDHWSLIYPWFEGSPFWKTTKIPTPAIASQALEWSFLTCRACPAEYLQIWYDNNWLVVEPPLWKIWKSIGMIIPNIWENKSHVPVTTNQTRFITCPFRTQRDALFHRSTGPKKRCSERQG